MKDFPHWFPHFWSAFLAFLGSGQGGDALMSKGIRKCWFMQFQHLPGDGVNN